MASLKVPATVPLPEEDAEQLYKAFKGLCPSLYPFINLLVITSLAFAFFD